MKYQIIIITLLVTYAQSTASSIREHTFTSTLIPNTFSCAVVLPKSYTADSARGHRFPVVYFLHCAGCSKESYYKDPGYCTPLTTLIDAHTFIAVCIDDGGILSWWLDSPLNDHMQVSTFLAKVLVNRIDSLYATLPSREARGLTGHSMGGFGALHNLIKHPDIFSAAFSIKGGLDPTLPLSRSWGSDFGLNTLLGTQSSQSVNWDAVNILKNCTSLKDKKCSIAFYSGKNDSWFSGENRKLDTILTQASLPHFFSETSEDHYAIPDTQIKLVLAYFDSVFAPFVSVAPHSKYHKRNSLSKDPSYRTSRDFTINGRSLPIDPAHTNCSLYSKNKLLDPKIKTNH